MPTNDSILISLTACQLAALKDLIERAAVEGIVPVEDRDKLDSVLRRVKVRLRKVRGEW